jgi:hypothetical protein
LEGIKPDPTTGGRTIDASKAIQTLLDTTDDLMNANQTLLPRIGEYSNPTNRETLRKAAYNKLRGTKNQIAKDMKKIDVELDAYDETMSLLEVDKLRADARKSAKIKADDQNIFDAIMEASRDEVFKKADQVAKRFGQTVDEANVFAALRTEIKDNLTTIEFVRDRLDGQVLPGGRLGVMFAQGIGAAIGAKGGPLTALLGIKGGDAIARIAMNNRFGGAMRMRLIRNISDDPAVLKAAQSLIDEIGKFDPTKVLGLPSPAIRLPGRTIQDTGGVFPAGKGTPGRTPKGQPGGGKFFRTFSSTPEDLTK